MNVQKESTDTLSKKQDAERDNLAIRQERERASQKIIATRKRVTSNNKIAENLMKKAEASGISLDIIEEVYSRGLETNRNAFDRVNSFINGGMARHTVDADLWEAVVPKSKDKALAGAIAGMASGAQKNPFRANATTGAGVMGPTLASVFPSKKKLATEEGGAGEEGTDKLRKQYAKDTPGQYEDIDIAPFSASKSWEVDETRDTLKTPKTFQQIRMALAGHREVKESTGKVDELSIPKMIQYSTASRSQAAAHSRIFKGNKVTPADDALVAKRKSGDELVSKRLARKYKQIKQIG